MVTGSWVVSLRWESDRSQFVIAVKLMGLANDTDVMSEENREIRKTFPSEPISG